MNLDDLGDKIDKMDTKLSQVHAWQLKMNGTLKERCPAHARRIGNVEKCLWGLVILMVGIGLRVIIGG